MTPEKTLHKLKDLFGLAKPIPPDIPASGFFESPSFPNPDPSSSSAMTDSFPEVVSESLPDPITIVVENPSIRVLKILGVLLFLVLILLL